MAGKFINTTYKETLDGVTSFAKDLLDNPLYKFNDKKATRVKYWNTNKELSTLDPGSKLEMIEVGEESPVRFNLIEDLIIYGLSKIEVNLENGDFGLEAEPITGECYIMPGDIEPIPGDFFQVEYITDGPWLFIVTAADRDTLSTGSNVWKIQYRLERHELESITKNVVDYYIMIDKQEGTNTKSCVLKRDYLEAVDLDNLCATLKGYFIDLFFSDPVQTFIYKYLNESNMYDPFLIEFIIRNKLLENNSSDYVHIMHQTPMPNTFAIDYDRSFYRAFELCDKNKLKNSVCVSQANLVTSKSSIFSLRYENYFELDYHPITRIPSGPTNMRDYIEIFPEDLIDHIINNIEVVELDRLYQNTFVKYFNGININNDDLEYILNIDYNSAKVIFYMLPLIIFVLESYIKRLLS